jgi:protein-S-isoprenylcysteine O-methyltransferase Ste14
VNATSPDPIAAQSFHRRRFRWRGAVGCLLLLPAAFVSLFSPPLFAASSWLHLAAQTAAWASFLAGAGLRFWATLYVGGKKERELVIDGPYSVCRHPLYVGSLLLGVSAGLFLESPLFLAASVLVGMLYMRATVPVEEHVLRARHAERYDAYVRRVPRYWPSGCTVHSPAQISVDVHRLWLECGRASRWMWLPMLGATFTYLRALAWWPRIFRLF